MRNNSALKITGFTLLAIAIALGIYMLNNWQFNKRYAWINLSKVYNEFGLKKDLEGKFKAVESERQKVLDSLELHLKLMANQLEALPNNKDKVYEFQTRRQEYLVKKQQFDEDNERLRADYNTQVLTQINQYVKEYATAEGISVVLGADGTGAVMYAAETLEITNPLVVFINNKYTGTK